MVGAVGRAGQGTVGAGSTTGRVGVDGQVPLGSEGAGVGRVGAGRPGVGGVGSAGTVGVGEAGKLGWAGMPGSEPDADPLALPVAPSGVTPTLAEPLTPVPLDFGGVDFAGAVVGEVAGAVVVGAGAVVGALPAVTVVVFTVWFGSVGLHVARP